MTDEIKNAADLESDRAPLQSKDQSKKTPRKAKREREPQGGTPGLGGQGGDERDGARGGQR